MVEPSESARRIESLFRRFHVPLDAELTKADILTQKKAMGLALPGFIERFREELESAETSANAGRILKLKLKQLEDVAEVMAAQPPGSHLESDELGLVSNLMEIAVTLLSVILGKEYREEGA